MIINDKSARPIENCDDDEKALLLLLGKKIPLEISETTTSRQEMVERYLISISEADIESCLNEFEFSAELLHRKEAAQALIAYFNWCWKMDKRDGSNGTPIDNYVLRFSQIALKRMVGISPNSNENSAFNLIPKWISPNAAFGWVKAPNRPRVDNTERDIAIAAYIEKLRRDGCEINDCKKRAAQRFDLGQSSIDKAFYWDSAAESAFGTRFNRYSDRELADLVSYYEVNRK